MTERSPLVSAKSTTGAKTRADLPQSGGAKRQLHSASLGPRKELLRVSAIEAQSAVSQHALKEQMLRNRADFERICAEAQQAFVSQETMPQTIQFEMAPDSQFEQVFVDKETTRQPAAYYDAVLVEYIFGKEVERLFDPGI